MLRMDVQRETLAQSPGSEHQLLNIWAFTSNRLPIPGHSSNTTYGTVCRCYWRVTQTGSS